MAERGRETYPSVSGGIAFGSAAGSGQVLGMMPVYKRLSHYSDLSEKDFEPLASLRMKRQTAARGQDLVVAGDPLGPVFVVEQGWAIRYQMLSDGRRQVLNVLLPGDMFDLQVFVAAHADHSVQAVTEMVLQVAQPAQVLDVIRGAGPISLALWWAAAQEEAILRQQIVRNGRRSATERVVHFLLELHRRLLIVSSDQSNGFNLPLTQTIVGDALGLSHIHVNRVLRRLARQGLIERDRSRIELRDRDALVAMCDFDPSYLNLDADAKRSRLAILREVE